jgi:hypothetical protein
MRHGRRDANEAELIELARRLGAWLIKLDEPCDWLMFYRGRWELVEVKDPAVEGHADEFTPAQRAFRAEAFRRGAKLITWRTNEDVIECLNGRVAA